MISEVKIKRRSLIGPMKRDIRCSFRLRNEATRVSAVSDDTEFGRIGTTNSFYSGKDMLSRVC